jgi:hypothetical protein
VIGKQIPRKASGAAARTTLSDFARIIAYVCAKADAVEMRNVLGDGAEAADEMWAIATGNTRCATKTLHFALSWPETECPTNAQAIAAMETLLEELGLEDHQAAIGVHCNTGFMHVHAAVNKIHPRTFAAWRSSRSYERIELACRKIELAQGWSQDRGRFDIKVGEGADGPTVQLVPKPQTHWEEKKARRAAGRGPSQRDVETERKTGMPPLCDALSDAWKIRIRAVLDGATNWPAVHDGLCMIGLAYVKKGSGAQIRIIGSDTVMNASQLGGRFARKKMEARIGVFEGLQETVDAAPVSLPEDRPCRIYGQLAEEAAALTKSQTFKATLLARSYIGITLQDAVVRAIKRVDLDEVPPHITLIDGSVVVDEGAELSATADGDVTVQAQLMMAMGKAKGWTRCKVEGPPDFLRAAALAAAEAGLAISGVPEDIVAEVAEELAAKAAALAAGSAIDKPAHPAATGPRPDHAAADAAREAAAAARQEESLRRAERAAAQAADREELATLLDEDDCPVAKALALGLGLHHRQQRQQDRESRERTALVDAVPLSVQDRRRRAAWRVLTGRDAVTGQGWDADVSPILDHTACRQLWTAADVMAAQAAGIDKRAMDIAEQDDPARDLRVLPDSTILFAHRDDAGNIIGFEVARQNADGILQTTFAQGGRRTGAAVGQPAFADRLVITAWAIDAKELEVREGRSDTLYLSLGGAVDADNAAQLQRLAAGRAVVIAVADESLARDVMTRIPSATLLNWQPDVLDDEVDVGGNEGASNNEFGADLDALDKTHGGMSERDGVDRAVQETEEAIANDAELETSGSDEDSLDLGL